MYIRIKTSISIHLFCIQEAKHMTNIVEMVDT